MKPVARIIVKETAGIRRYLYPLTVEGIAPGAAATARLRVCEPGGALLPSGTYPPPEGRQASSRLRVPFAISLAPYEKRELLLAETGEIPAVPDPMRAALDEAGGLTTQQERVRFHVSARTGLDSVVYDTVEHLAGPLSISLDGEPAEAPYSAAPDWDDTGLSASLEVQRAAALTAYRLTACKSWVSVEHVVQAPVAGKTIAFSLPLRALDETPTCDLGVGNGVYEKIGGEAVVWTTEFGQRPYARWRVSTVSGGQERIDYQGEYRTSAQFAGRAWFHFIEKSKALAVAVCGVAPRCLRLTATLSRNGRVDIAFTMAQDAPPQSAFSLCYHFLNDIPPIAAATNPESILLPPAVSLAPL